MLGLTPGNLITHLRKLEDAGYVTTVKSGNGVNARTSVSLSGVGRKALGNYTAVLRQLLDSAAPTGPARTDRARQTGLNQSVLAAVRSYASHRKRLIPLVRSHRTGDRAGRMAAREKAPPPERPGEAI